MPKFVPKRRQIFFHEPSTSGTLTHKTTNYIPNPVLILLAIEMFWNHVICYSCGLRTPAQGLQLWLYKSCRIKRNSLKIFSIPTEWKHNFKNSLNLPFS